MPRNFKPYGDDKYMIEENEDVTEMYFIMSGRWGIGYNVDTTLPTENGNNKV